jgi:hypothetical protein
MVPLLFIGCGGGVATPSESTDAGAESSSAGDSSSFDEPNDDVTSCETLVLAFVGCDDERRQECAREYSSVSPMNRVLVDDAAACLKANRPSVASAVWPPVDAVCTPTSVPPLESANDLWFHGVCEGDNGDVATSLPADPSFPPCGGDSGEPACFFGDDNSGATL